jgi:AraC-like DNA-binding protein
MGHLMQPAIPSVSTLYADALAAFLTERGLPPALAVAAPPVHTQRVAAASFADVLAGGERELDDAALGLTFGTRVGTAGFGMLGIAAASAPTLAESIRQLTQLESLTSTLGHASVRRHAKLVHLSWRPAQPVAPTVIEGILSGWVSYGRYLLGEHVGIVQVALAHRRRASLPTYEDAFDAPVRFGQAYYRVTFGDDLLDARPRFADAPLYGALDAWIDHCTAGIACGRKTLARTVAGLVGQQLSQGGADELTIACLLGLGPRTLQRMLRDEGTSFRQIVNAARAQHAVLRLLHGQGSLSDLGASVGFEEQSSLCRSFRRWTGYAPLEFRQRMAGIYGRLRAR